MNQFRVFTVSDLAIKQAAEMGLDPQCVADMARMSAAITHAWGNRRYDQYIMEIDGNRVLSIASTTPAVKTDRRTPEQKARDKAHVEKMTALHFPRSSMTT
jgi:hypothetical protein